MSVRMSQAFKNFKTYIDEIYSVGVMTSRTGVDGCRAENEGFDQVRVASITSLDLPVAAADASHLARRWAERLADTVPSLDSAFDNGCNAMCGGFVFFSIGACVMWFVKKATSAHLAGGHLARARLFARTILT
ncbi:hypothetical protein EVAR_78653_1 [Eumeta japonica]|uniref:Uncharacterized protein n=1 Tax=Eumeta variegata TaxID=151549 RepID=A0A4C1U9A7_EUMVA|nr:hypothetical protein EVAR_78653_1 [Eumeta japonica]